MFRCLYSLTAHVEAGNFGLTFALRKVTTQYFHCGGLARAVGPQKGNDLAFRDGEGNVFDRNERAKVLRKPFCFDHHLL